MDQSGDLGVNEKYLNMKYEEICKNFIDEKVSSVRPLGNGHINATFLVETEGQSYVLQRLQMGMDTERLEHNYNLYSPVFDSDGWLYPKWLKTKMGEYWFSEHGGDKWRMYPYIDGDILTSPLEQDTLFACGQGLAHMHCLLQKVSGTPKAIYPRLHDLSFYYDKYVRTAGSRASCVSDKIGGQIQEKIESLSARFLAVTADDQLIIHGDTKLSNALFDKGDMIGFLDFDTIMPGSVITDIADCIRSSCIIDGVLVRESAECLIEGYLSAAPQRKEEVLRDWEDTLGRICYELAIRYYTDILSGENSFIEKYPGYRLDRVMELLGI